MTKIDRLGRPLPAIMDAELLRGRRPANAGCRYPAEVLHPDEVLRLLAACRRGTYGRRDRALIVLLWRTGLRISEALALEPRDLDLERGMVTVREGKGLRRRVVGIDPRAALEVQGWMDLRATLVPRPWQGPVWITVRSGTVGAPLQAAAWRESLHQLAYRARIGRRVHPHGLRHTHAMELLREGVPVPMIQRQLGHGELSTTAHYLNHLAPLEVVDRIRERSWPTPH